ncbi:hypothetical protein ES288_A06G187600v1 [Gossypium darwinii]|uniref:Secreted protein n=1 Tax=Gossypium darwinii TaxID=34276 RepID=A0A5D2G7L8_GOSDA|nr:hypothetical protein ES288_A06G187600v1 [Gossypium darwinii]
MATLQKWPLNVISCLLRLSIAASDALNCPIIFYSQIMSKFLNIKYNLILALLSNHNLKFRRKLHFIFIILISLFF